MKTSWIAVLAAAAAPMAMAAAPASNATPPADVALGREIFKQLIEINTTHAHGSTAAAQAIADRLVAAGYLAADVKVLSPPDKPTKGNVIVRIHGKLPSLKPVLFVGHLDVVEARPEDWSTDPFKLVEKGGYFYGRGAIDMKEGDAALVETLIRLKREAYQPDRDLIFAMTADEEAGGDANGPEWLLKTHRDLIDAGVVLNFDGGGGELKDGKPVSYGLETSEKIYLTYRLETTSPGGHGSLPGPDNAIYRLAAGLGRLSAYTFPVMMTATTRASFAHLAALEAGPQKADFQAVSQPTPDPAAAERLSRNVFFNAQLRTTCVATLISGGHAENALPQRATATVQCRMMPGDTAQAVQQRITAAVADPKIAVSLDVAPIQAPESPLTPAVLGKIEGTVHSLWPGVPVVPSMATGFSDGRQFRNAGMPTYSAGGVFMEQGENRAHGRDERVSVASFDQSLEYAYRLVKAFGRKD